MRELEGALQELDAAETPGAVHRCRVRLKRARALARVGRACAPGMSERFNEAARVLMHTLATPRELTALAETARITAKQTGPRRAAALLQAASALEAERDALPPLDLEAVRTSLAEIGALAQVWPEASPGQVKRGAARIVRRARKARTRGRGAIEHVLRHEWRKREKDRLFGAMLLDKTWPAPRRRKLGQKLGDVLGDERDALILLDRLQQNPRLAGGDKATERAVRALRKRCARLGKRADAIGARLHSGRA